MASGCATSAAGCTSATAFSVTAATAFLLALTTLPTAFDAVVVALRAAISFFSTNSFLITNESGTRAECGATETAAAAGGGGLGAGGQGGGFQAAGQLPNFGPDLVDLIQRVISPDSWDVVGGPGTIVYYAPLQAIVVRGTLETQENIIQLLFDLRAAGGP